METRWSRTALALMSGVLMALCLPRPGLCFLAWPALVPLIVICWKSDKRCQGGLYGFLAGFAYHGVALYWVYNTCRYGGIPNPEAPHFLKVGFSLAAWAALAAVLALDWALAAALGTWASRRVPRALAPWAWAVFWTAVTVAAERWTPRLCIDLLGYTQYRNLSLLQIGSAFGPHGLGFLVVAVNACLAQAWLELEEGGAGPAAANCALSVGLVFCAWAYGIFCLAGRPVQAASARVEILQPNIDQYQKFDETYEELTRGNFIELLSRPRPENPYLVVWPESAMPTLVQEGETVADAAPWSRKLGSYQVVGVVSKDAAGCYNSAFLLGSDGKFQGSYHKRELVPFGEYVPLKFLERFIGLLAQMGGLSAGAPRQALFATPLGPAAATICYEAMFPRWANLDASRGARLIFNVTNDGWYKNTWGPFQHFQANVFRAVENRVSVVRSGNTGISAVIDPWGVITARLELNRRGRLDGAVALQDFFPERSFYARHGDWFGSLCLIATVLLALFCLLIFQRPAA